MRTREGKTPADVAHRNVAPLLSDAALELQKQHAFCDLAREGEFGRVRAMVEADPALVSVQPAGRWSALHQAASAGCAETVRFLLAKGANKAATTRQGETPLDVADRDVAVLLGGRPTAKRKRTKRAADSESEDEEADSEMDDFIVDDEETDEDYE